MNTNENAATSSNANAEGKTHAWRQGFAANDFELHQACAHDTEANKPGKTREIQKGKCTANTEECACEENEKRGNGDVETGGRMDIERGGQGLETG